jgi:hypothetical protein
MNKMRILVAIVLMLIGAVWIFQGIGWLGGSFMTGSMTWFYIGLVAAAAGLGLLLLPRR